MRISNQPGLLLYPRYGKQHLKTCLTVSVLAFALRWFYVSICLLSINTTEFYLGHLCQLYFGGICIEYAFDVVTISIHMILVLLEVVILTADLYHGLLENLDVLVSRMDSRRKLYRYFFHSILYRNVIVLLVEYLLFFTANRALPTSADLAILLSFFAQLLLLQLTYFAIGFFFHTTYGYMWTIGFYFLPITFIGFCYSYEREGWKIGRYFSYHYVNYNWYHQIGILDTEWNIPWESVFFSHPSDIKRWLGIGLWILALYLCGKWRFRKQELL